jgi:Delta3,5-Delta2,4-dienoyl-CoA isomerase
MQPQTLPSASRPALFYFLHGREIMTQAFQEVDVGLAADIGTLTYLPKVTGNDSLVRELAYTARPFSSSEAAQLGFVSRVVEGSRDEVVKAALDLAILIAAKSPVAVYGSKILLTHARDHTYAPFCCYGAR